MDYCYHCHGLSDSEVEQLQERVSKDNAGHRELGMTMLFFTAGGGALLLSILLLAVLFG